MARPLICENYVEINGKDIPQWEIKNFHQVMEKIFTEAMKNIGFKRKDKTA